MSAHEIYFAMVVGTLLSLIYVEVTNFLPAGIVVPGYLALRMENPTVLLGIFLISIMTYYIVVYGIAKVTILYGKRKFAAMIVVAVLLKLIGDVAAGNLFSGPVELEALGVVVPGLLANTIERQGVLVTLGSTTFMALVTFLGLVIFRMVA